MKYTLITPTYNCEKTLKKTIESVLSQDYLNFEYIIVDGKSKDETLEIIKSYRKYFFEKKINYNYISEEDNGIYDAMNKGIKLAKGEFIYFLGGDDTLYNNKVLNDVEEYLEIDKILYGRVIKKSSEKEFYLDRGINRVTKLSLFRRPVCHQSLFTPRVLFEKVGLYDCSYKIKSDHKWQLVSIFNQNIKYKRINIIIAEFSLNGVSSKLEKKIKQEALKMYSEFYPKYLIYLKKIWWKIKNKRRK